MSDLEGVTTTLSNMLPLELLANDELLPVSTAAPLVGLAPVSLRQMCREGRVRAQHFGGVWALRRSDVAALAAARRAKLLATMPDVIC
jgi:hypothetical protein